MPQKRKYASSYDAGVARRKRIKERIEQEKTTVATLPVRISQ
jgi:hypothetical protein